MSEVRKITAIELQKKRKDRYSVFVNNEFAFGIHQDVLLKSGIAAGDELSLRQIHKIQIMEEDRAAKEKAMQLLKVRDRSLYELRQRLSRTGFSEESINRTIADLKKYDLLNDTKFAKMFSRSRMITKPVGAFYLKREMIKKGLSESDIKAGVEEAYREKSEYDYARIVAQRGKKKYQKLEPDKAKQRVSDLLARRGFHYEMISDVIEHWDEL